MVLACMHLGFFYASPCQADDNIIGEKLEDIGRQRKVMECHKKGCEQAKLRYESMLGSSK